MKWKPYEIAKLKNLAAQNFEAYDIATALGKGFTTPMVVQKGKELGIRFITSKRKSYMKGEPMDDYDQKVVEAVRAGHKDLYDVIRYTHFRSERIKEINKRLGLGIKTERFDNQCANMLATSFSRTY